MERGKDYSACFSCPEYAKCNTGTNMHCLYDYNLTQSDLSWRDRYHENENVLQGFTYGDIILALRQEKVKDAATVKRIVKEILEIQLEDMEYLVELNMDQILKEVK